MLEDFFLPIIIFLLEIPILSASTKGSLNSRRAHIETIVERRIVLQ